MEGASDYRKSVWRDQHCSPTTIQIDMDRDGDLDILVAGFENNNVVCYGNRLAKKP